MLIKKVCILGGTGFVGRTLSNRLAEEGISLKILTRSREYHKENLILLPAVDLVQADIHDPEQLNKHFAGCDAVINLVGILNEKGRDGKGFHKAHVELTEKVINSCKLNRIRRLLHMSALHADVNHGKSHYLKSKGMAENLIQKLNPKEIRYTLFRPSVIFGRDDSFFNRFANILKLSPIMPLACAKSRFAPVYVGDIAEVFAMSLNNPSSFGATYNLCGPKIYTLQQLVEYTEHCLGISRWIIPLNDFFSRLQGMVFDFVPGKPFSTDNYLSAKTDSVCTGHNDLYQLIDNPQSVEAVVPGYLSNKNQRARYYKFRQQTSQQTEF